MKRPGLKQLVSQLTYEEGQDLAEYGLLASLIALAVVLILPQIGGAVNQVFSSIAGVLP